MTATSYGCPYCMDSAILGAVYYNQNCVGCVKRMTADRPVVKTEQDAYCDLHCADEHVLGCVLSPELSMSMFANRADYDAAVAATLCMCKDRPLAECPGEWEPGCDLGNNPKFVKAYVPAAPDPANSYARGLAVALHASHYPEVTQWRPLDDTLGLLTQIDNMTCSLVRPAAARSCCARPTALW